LRLITHAVHVVINQYFAQAYSPHRCRIDDKQQPNCAMLL
jgi:hypothetical protein